MTTLAANGLAARIALAMLVAVGILYANFGPLIVSGLAHRDFTAASAGYLFSVNLYGTALGGMLIVFLVRRVPWRIAAALLLLGVLGADLASIWLDDHRALHVVRFLHGVAGGASMGVFGSVIARTTNPERTFALTVALQVVLGGVADDPVEARRGPWSAIALGCAALFAYQAGQMATFAYVIELAERRNFDAEFIGRIVAIGQWVGGPASSSRGGRRAAAVGCRACWVRC